MMRCSRRVRRIVSARAVFSIAALAATMAAAAPVAAQAPNVTDPDAAGAYTITRVPAPSAIAVTGRFIVKVTLHVNSTIPRGTKIPVGFYAAIQDQSFYNSIGVSGMATVAGGTAEVTLDVPYSSLVGSTKDPVILNVEFHADGASKSGQFEYYDSENITRTIALPANGATTKLLFRSSL
jgi:hypothetical protein